MTRYFGLRLASALPRLALISIFLFALIHTPPGGPADIYAADPSATAADVARIKELWGLDQPVPLQYGRWLRNAISGDWGQSFSERRPVLATVLERLPNTVLLTASAVAISLVFGLLLGVLGASHPSRAVREGVQGAAVLGLSVPTFWSGALVLLIFSANLRWIPSGGAATIGAPFSIGDRLLHLVGPALVLGSIYIAQWTRYLQAGLSEVLREDYVRTARAKGLAGRVVLVRHALRNAVLPLITLLGLEIPRLLSGALVTEVVFAWPGVGRLLTGALLQRDYPLVMGVLMLLAFAVVAVNILTDVAYALVDPRVRFG
ncbi:MAG: ABC transporter permease [Armatimonadetes bacterium]|nr:ABC transporter permease [Armatimonadota bacterium]